MRNGHAFADSGALEFLPVRENFLETLGAQGRLGLGGMALFCFSDSSIHPFALLTRSGLPGPRGAMHGGPGLAHEERLCGGPSVAP